MRAGDQSRGGWGGGGGHRRRKDPKNLLPTVILLLHDRVPKLGRGSRHGRLLCTIYVQLTFESIFWALAAGGGVLGFRPYKTSRYLNVCLRL